MYAIMHFNLQLPVDSIGKDASVATGHCLRQQGADGLILIN